MTKNVFKISLGILVILAGSFLLFKRLEAEGLKMCYAFQCNAVVEACYAGEFSFAKNHYAYCDYNICVSHWRVTCIDRECEDCTPLERLYIRWAKCEDFNSSCSSGGFF